MQTARCLRSMASGISKEHMWYGNVVRADDTLPSLIDELYGVREEDRDAGRPPQLVKLALESGMARSYLGRVMVLMVFPR